MADETPPAPPGNGNGNGTNGKTRVTLVRGLLAILAVDIVCMAILGMATQMWPTQQWDIVKEVVSGQLTLATVISSGLVGMAKGSSS